MANVKQTRWAATVLCGLLLLTAGARQVRADQPSQAAVSRAANTLQNKRSAIALYMYPFSKLTSVEFKTSSGYGDGSFDLTYRYHFTFGKEVFWGEMKFGFDQGGGLLYAQPGSYTTGNAPGSTAELTFDAFKALFPDAPAGLSARGVLEWYLQLP
jgi:hypothetical protein